MLLGFLCVTASAGEIVSWKLPLSRIPDLTLQAPGVARCQAIPEPSVFFREGDELWDLSKAMPRRPPEESGSGEDRPLQTKAPLDWIVWNASSGRIVAKANWSGLWQLHQQLDAAHLPVQCRIQVDSYPMPADGTPPADAAPPAASLSVIARSGGEFEAATKTGEISLRFKGKADLSATRGIVELATEIFLDPWNQPRVEIKTGVAVRAGEPVSLARESDGTTGWDIRVSAQIETPDGTPFSEMVQIEKDTKAKTLVMNTDPIKERQGDGWLLIAWLPQGNREFIDAHGFTNDAIPAEPSGLAPYQEVTPPESINRWISHPILNARNWFEAKGILSFTGSDFVGYDPLQQRVFSLTTNELAADLMEQLLNGGCRLPLQNVAMSLEGQGGLRLLGRPEQGMEFRRIGVNGEKIHSVSVQPVVDAAASTIRLSDLKQSPEGAQETFTTTLAVKEGPFTGIDQGTLVKSVRRGKWEILSVTPGGCAR